MTGYLCVADVSAPGQPPHVAVAMFRDREQAGLWSQGGPLAVVEVEAGKYLKRWPAPGWARFSPQDQSHGELCRRLSEAGIDPTSGELELPPEFPARLNALRERAGMTPGQLAAAAGTTTAAVSRYESGARRPTWDAIQALAAALGVTTDTFRDRG